MFDEGMGKRTAERRFVEVINPPFVRKKVYPENRFRKQATWQPILAAGVTCEMAILQQPIEEQ